MLLRFCSTWGSDSPRPAIVVVHPAWDTRRKIDGRNIDLVTVDERIAIRDERGSRNILGGDDRMEPAEGTAPLREHALRVGGLLSIRPTRRFRERSPGSLLLGFTKPDSVCLGEVRHESAPRTRNAHAACAAEVRGHHQQIILDCILQQRTPNARSFEHIDGSCGRQFGI